MNRLKNNKKTVAMKVNQVVKNKPIQTNTHILSVPHILASVQVQKTI